MDMNEFWISFHIDNDKATKKAYKGIHDFFFFSFFFRLNKKLRKPVSLPISLDPPSVLSKFYLQLRP